MFPAFKKRTRLANTQVDSRRSFPRHLLQKTTTLGLLLVGTIIPQLFCATPLQADQAQRPNIVYIMADDLGYGDLGCYGQEQIRTPNIDKLCAQGMKFTDFYAGCTVCAPSRCVLMTGLHMGHCYIRGNGKNNLRPEDVTVAEVLADANYTSGLVGKWGLGHEGSTGLPTKQGFDYFYGYLDQHHAHNYYPTFLVRNEQRVPLRNVVPNEGQYGQGVASVKRDYSATLIANEALGFIEKQDGKRPFFLYYAATQPHANNEANRVSKAAAMEIPDYGQYADKDWPDAEKGLAAMISDLDNSVGKLMAVLKQKGFDDNTIVFFTSDNGPHAEGSNPKFFDSNGPLRGIKRDLYDGGIRVPMIVRWPGKIQAGSVSNHPAYFTDFMPTAAELAGVKLTTPTDGISFVPTLLGQPGKQKKHAELYWEFYEGKNARAVRMGHWKGVEIPYGSGKVEVYDLDADLAEEHNIAAEHPEIVAEVKAVIAREHVPSPDWKVRVRKPAAKRN